MIFQYHLLIFLAGTAGFLLGTVGVDMDHFLPRPLFHFFPVVVFITMFTIGMLIHIFLDYTQYGSEYVNKWMIRGERWEPLKIKDIVEHVKKPLKSEYTKEGYYKKGGNNNDRIKK